MLEVHRQHRVTWLEQRGVHREVRRRPRVRLQVGVVGAEELLGPGDADLLGDVDVGAAAVVAPTRVSLGVLVRQRRPGRSQHRRRGEVLARDQLQPAAQPIELIEDHCGDLRVGLLQGVEVGTPVRRAAHGDLLRTVGVRTTTPITLASRVHAQCPDQEGNDLLHRTGDRHRLARGRPPAGLPAGRRGRRHSRHRSRAPCRASGRPTPPPARTRSPASVRSRCGGAGTLVATRASSSSVKVRRTAPGDSPTTCDRCSRVAVITRSADRTSSSVSAVATKAAGVDAPLVQHVGWRTAAWARRVRDRAGACHDDLVASSMLVEGVLQDPLHHRRPADVSRAHHQHPEGMHRSRVLLADQVGGDLHATDPPGRRQDGRSRGSRSVRSTTVDGDPSGSSPASR